MNDIRFNIFICDLRFKHVVVLNNRPLSGTKIFETGFLTFLTPEGLKVLDMLKTKT